MQVMDLVGEFTTTTNVSYDFRGTVGTFTGNAPTTDLVTAMKNGFSPCRL